ncbi:fibronectin type III domain-containing protein, partial [Nocardiopsis tropica]|nr:fibronectin type III domain-containing protein [Nocardiopsis tropica]
MAGLCACTPQAASERPVDRVLLSPTADPGTSQTMTWHASGAEESFLEIGPDDGSEETVRVDGSPTGGDEPGSTFAATATGLEPDTAYRYRIGAIGAGEGSEEETGDWRTFTTAAEGAEPFSFLYFGDIQNDITEDADLAATYLPLVNELAALDLAYLHVAEQADRALTDRLRAAWPNTFVLNPATGSGVPTGPDAVDLVADGTADLVSFGALFLANPDLPARLAA